MKQRVADGQYEDHRYDDQVAPVTPFQDLIANHQNQSNRKQQIDCRNDAWRHLGAEEDDRSAKSPKAGQKD